MAKLLSSGNCDNCAVSKERYNMSEEAFLLMTCIQSCEGKWDLDMPIDILHGSRDRKIIDAKFDKLGLHGLGETHPADWWEAFGQQLITQDYLKETVSDTCRTISSKGKQFLDSFRPDFQPPFHFPLTGREEENRSTLTFKIFATSEWVGFSKAEGLLYRSLLEERSEIAREVGTPPYVVCGDQTIKKIALTKPLTKAKLEIIDGVNQHLVTNYGDRLLKVVFKNLARELPRATLDVWNMWQNQDFSIQEIAKCLMELAVCLTDLLLRLKSMLHMFHSITSFPLSSS